MIVRETCRSWDELRLNFNLTREFYQMHRPRIVTERRVQKRVSPEAFREIFAHYGLQQHPKDYERLAEILWMDIPW